MTNTFDEQPQSATGKPTALAPRIEDIPAELKAIPNWLLWKYEPPKKPDGKWRKVHGMPTNALGASPVRFSGPGAHRLAR